MNSFTSVSLDPPLVQFAIARTALAFDLWRQVNAFAINLLDENRIHLSRQFAVANEDKWRGIHFREGEYTGTPILMDARTHFECVHYARYDGGDHELVLGRVLGLQLAQPADAPLVFHDGRYRRLHRECGSDTVLETEGLVHGW